MRLRTDSWHDAGAKRAVQLGARPDPTTEPALAWYEPYAVMLADDAFEAAQPGDAWRLVVGTTWPKVRLPGQEPPDVGVTIGYALTCPVEKCPEGVHHWAHARDCEARMGQHRPCKAGGPSCWTWTGSPEAGDLTAVPSLWMRWDRCGFHGFLTGGELRSV